MENIKRRLIFMAVLLILFLAIYFTFYSIDRTTILKETQSYEWTETKVGMLYLFSGLERLYFVSYKDKAGQIHRSRRCSVYLSKVIWREE